MKSCNCYECREGRDRREEIRHGGVTDEELPHRSARKDTKKWCKGKVGREHDYEWRTLYLSGRVWYHIKECKKCFKQGDWKFPRFDF